MKHPRKDIPAGPTKRRINDSRSLRNGCCSVQRLMSSTRKPSVLNLASPNPKWRDSSLSLGVRDTERNLQLFEYFWPLCGSVALLMLCVDSLYSKVRSAQRCIS